MMACEKTPQPARARAAWETSKPICIAPDSRGRPVIVHQPSPEKKALLHAALRDDGLHAPTELGTGEERLPHLLASLRSLVQLVDPELHALLVAAATQKCVVHVAHELRIRAGACTILGAAHESLRDRIRLRGDGARALALR